MGSLEIGQAVHEVDSILRRTQCEVYLISCDDAAHVAGKISSVQQVKLVGGGGTDMGKGIAAALKLRPRPPIAITITDGYTDWPVNPPPIRHVCVLVGSGRGPKWGKTVKVVK
jgi:predicted metal-dependent peptidase